MTTAPNEIAQHLSKKIRSHDALVGVIGLGYVGLPLLDAYVRAGFSAVGFDVDDAKVQQLNRGKSYIAHIPSEKIAAWREEKRFRATSDMAELSQPDVILICVPTPLSESRDPDLQYVEATARSIAHVLRPGQLVILESTSYPGTTRDVVLPILNESKLTAGRQFFLAFSPAIWPSISIRKLSPRLSQYRAARLPRPARSLKTPIAASTLR
jgi:UDP-N-acetyl-D-glucosamine dehydrogenase